MGEGRSGAGQALGESEREELARLRRQKAEWPKERAELEMEREGFKRSVVPRVKEVATVADRPGRRPAAPDLVRRDFRRLPRDSRFGEPTGPHRNSTLVRGR
ncbi:hypothetical protein AB0H37_35260 [Actinomadura sp. NPDC023710]|uniref:hypothetical protein n=1 Tax=Actinomadura sp. NPDC023710 TaxID=3158219 RepID=UPI0033CDC101